VDQVEELDVGVGHRGLVVGKESTSVLRCHKGRCPITYLSIIELRFLNRDVRRSTSKLIHILLRLQVVKLNEFRKLLKLSLEGRTCKSTVDFFVPG